MPKKIAKKSKVPVKRGRGRPAEGRKRANWVLVGFTDEERAICQSGADAAGKPLTTWLRELGLNAAKGSKHE